MRPIQVKNSLLYYFSPSYLKNISSRKQTCALEVHRVSRASNRKRGIYRGTSEGVADRCVRDGEFVDAVGERSDDRCVFKSFSLSTRRAVDVRERDFFLQEKKKKKKKTLERRFEVRLRPLLRTIKTKKMVRW